MFISLGYLTKKSILFIIVPILMLIRLWLTDSVSNDAKNMFYCGFMKFIGKSINGILWIVV